MSINLNIYAVSLLIAGGIAGLISFLAFIKSKRAVKTFALMMACVTIWSLAYGIELTMIHKEHMLFWIRIEYIGIALIPAFWLLFCLQFSGLDSWLDAKKLSLIFGLPLITLLVVWTNSFHHLLYKSTSVAKLDGVFYLNINIGLWYVVNTFVFYFYLLVGMVVLIQKYRSANVIIKKQLAIILTGACIPWIANILYQTRIEPFEYLDITPYAFAITGVILSIGLLRFKLFEILPIAQERIIEQMSEGVLILDEHYQILYSNPAMQQLFKETNTEISGKHLFSINNGQYSLRDLLDQKKETSFEFSKDIANKQHYFDVSLKPFYDKIGSMTGYFLIFRDITRRKKNEEQIIHSREQAEAASRAKSDFLAHMSHEIRTPLNGIIGFVDLLSKTDLGPNQKGYTSIVQASAGSLLGIINEILDLSKIEAGKLDLHPEKTDLLNLCRQTADMFAWKLRQKHLDIELHVNPELPRFIITDMIRLKQVITNLLSNAIKFTEKGKIELIVERQGLEDDNMQIIRFSIKDTGIGIAPQNQQKIFNSFIQEDATTTRRFGGTGLGLTISNKLLALMNSRLQLESVLGEGSTFYFDLPVETDGKERVGEKQDDVSSRKISAAEEEKDISFKEKTAVLLAHPFTILVAEDSTVNMQLVTAVIKRSFPEVTIIEATNGKKALDYVNAGAETVDLIFMDVQMPEMNGYEATEKIRHLEKEKRTPIIALTAATLEEEQKKCFRAGMDDFISKPVLPKTLEETIFKWVDIDAV